MSHIHTSRHQKFKDEQMEEKPYDICRVCGKPATHHKEVDIGFTFQNDYYCEDCLYDIYLTDDDIFPLSFSEYLKLENIKEL